MKHPLSALVFFVVVSLTFLTACKKEAAALNESQVISPVLERTVASRMVPIKGSYETTTEFLSPPPMLLQRITGTGEASHLGKSTFVALATLDLTTPPPFSLAGTATFYAANGDVFYTEFTGIATLNPDGTRTVVIYHTITGGTGRFANATGSMTGNTIVDSSLPTNVSTYGGMISY